MGGRDRQTNPRSIGGGESRGGHHDGHKGPEIRTGALDEPISLLAGSRLQFHTDADYVAPASIVSIFCNYPDLPRDLQVGSTILVDSGLLRLTVLSKMTRRFSAKCLRLACLVPAPYQFAWRRSQLARVHAERCHGLRSWHRSRHRLRRIVIRASCQRCNVTA